MKIYFLKRGTPITIYGWHGAINGGDMRQYALSLLTTKNAIYQRDELIIQNGEFIYKFNPPVRRFNDPHIYYAMSFMIEYAELL